MNFRYPAFSDIKAIGVRGIYLGNFVRWDPYAQHIDMVQKFGFKGLWQSRTFDAYDHADCYVYSNIHDVFKFLKHGYSKVTDQASREIFWTVEQGASTVPFANANTSSLIRRKVL